MILAMTCLADDEGIILGAVGSIDMLQFLSYVLTGYLSIFCMGGLELVSKMIARHELKSQGAHAFLWLR